MRLAATAGIESGYWDGLGMRRDLTEATAAALLHALGFNPDADADTHFRTLNDAVFLAALPPSLVVLEGATAAMPLSLPLQQRETRIPWLLELEDGGQQRGEFTPAHLTQGEVRDINGLAYGRLILPLPEALPAGYHQFSLPTYSSTTKLIVAPTRCYIPEPMQQGARCWGLAVQLYTLRSSHNWGIGDFGDLAVLATAAGHAGAAFIGLNPLHARHLANPEEASPYAPSSRLFLDPVYIDVEGVDGFSDCPAVRNAIAAPEFQSMLAAARSAKLVDYAAVTALKLAVLELLFRHFREQGGNSGDADVAFRAFRQAGGPVLARFAEFEAMRLHLREATGSVPGWHEWHEELRHPDGGGLEGFRSAAADRIEFQAYLQWIAASQLQNAAASARAAGMSIGLYRDLAVGAAADSAENWSEQQLFAPGARIGAPPDMLNRQGQNWGLPPWNPQTLARHGYAQFSRLLAANMQNAGALRIDHVMGLMRLFWIPPGMSGADGGYVRNPFDELVAIVALESVRNHCMVIGEDLGSVPDGLRDRLRDRGVLSYRVLVYERHWQGDGHFCHPDEYPQQALATVATHDMPTIKEFWLGQDIARRAQLGMYPDAQQRHDEEGRRHAEREGILRLLGQLNLSPHDPANAEDAIVSLHAAVARTRSMLVQIQLDDLVGEIEPVNIPGTHREYPNWRRKLGMSIEAICSDPRWSRLAATMREAGRVNQ